MTHTDDLVARLREGYITEGEFDGIDGEATDALMDEAADRIIELEGRDALCDRIVKERDERIAELEGALKPFADQRNEWGRTHGDAYKFTLYDLRRARATLNNKEPN